jgi:hypothetical protein
MAYARLLHAHRALAAAATTEPYSDAFAGAGAFQPATLASKGRGSGKCGPAH